MSIFTEMESDVRGYCRDYPCEFVQAQGSELIDRQGERYLDFLAGAGTLNYGHNDPDLREAVIEHLRHDGVVHGLDLHTDAKRRFLEVFREHILEPRDLDYKVQFTGPTGTNAVEAALKLARKVTGRQQVISFTNGFHGMTLGALAATGNRHHRSASGMPLTGVTPMPYEGYLAQGASDPSLAMIEKYLTDPSSGMDLPAAMLVETIQGEGGLNIASRQWLRGLQGLCRKHGILLIVDDIQMGCGRAGSFFSFEQAEIEPDLVVLSKSLSGIGLPMALLLMQRQWDRWQPGEHNGTFRGNNLAFVAAAAAIEKFWTDNAFMRDVAHKGQLVSSALQQMRDENPGLNAKVRGRGMIWGLEVTPDIASQVVREAFERNLIIETCGSGGKVIKFLGPLTTPIDQLQDGLDRLRSSVSAAAASASEMSTSSSQENHQ